MNAKLIETTETLTDRANRSIGRTTFYILYGGPRGRAGFCNSNRDGEAPKQSAPVMPVFNMSGVYMTP